MSKQTKKTDVIKHSSAVHIEGKLNLLERKLGNILLANSFDDLLDKTKFEIKISDIYDYLGWKTRNDKHLKKALDSLYAISFKWNILGKDKETLDDMEDGRFISWRKVKNGVFYYEMPVEVKKKLATPKMYAKINLKLQNSFTTSNALVLYELAKDYYRIKDKRGETPFIKIEKLKALFGLDENTYPQFKVLNRDVIKTAVKAVNNLTDIFLEVETKRASRQVVALKFKIKQNPKYGQKTLLLEQEKEVESPKQKELREKIKKHLNLTEKQIDQLFQKSTIERIENSFEYLKQQQANDKVREPRKFFIACVYQTKKFDLTEIETQKKEAKEKEKKQIETRKKREKEKEKEAHQTKENKRLDRIFEQWTASHPKEFNDLCLNKIKEFKTTNNFFYQKIYEKGKDRTERLKRFKENSIYMRFVKKDVLKQIESEKAI